ncbi:MAG: bifunctional [glutamate--ammonia ligase]-adenylyl-L-tyrosine phosphorylase/[glutamate--ammonia-ligase] adenylyltransferase [Halofilum sp. (in: g-proteobacteria)]
MGERALATFEQAAEREGVALPVEDWRPAARAVMAASEFVGRVARQQPAAFVELMTQGRLAVDMDAAAYAARLRERLADVPSGDEAALTRAVARFRVLESARIAWRDLAGAVPIETALAEQSDLADACIQVALAQLDAWARERHGTPYGPEGEPQSLLVLGMGKLGGRELNFSSDIDLIFVFDGDGRSDGAKPLDSADYFKRLGQRLIRVLSETSSEGFAYRVDMRLRPFGASGPLVVHLAQLEHYLLTQAREWERFALVKARPITGAPSIVAAVDGLLRPFVFRRYLDFGAFESLRDLKGRLERELARKGQHGNVKHGAGGIREIEFIVQAFQLIRGGRDGRLRVRELTCALATLGELGDLTPELALDLDATYRYLRRIENRLQAVGDDCVHALPEDEFARARLAWTMGADDWPALCHELEERMSRVHACFLEVFNVSADSEGGDPEPGGDLAAVWEEEVDAGAASERLATAGFADPEEACRRLASLRASSRYRSLTAVARSRLDRLMPWLLADAGGAVDPDATLGRLLTLMEAIARRSVYLSLLAENAQARQRLVELCAASAWIADFVTRHPILLDELIDPNSLYEPADRAGLFAEIGTVLESLEADDLEAQMDALRQTKQANVLRVAAADITERLPLMRVSDYLTWTAEAVLEAVYGLVRAHADRRYGRPRVSGPDGERAPEFAIVGYGKLGGIELGYSSDLDLVFLHDAEGKDEGTDGPRPLDNATYFARVAQRLVHFLDTPTPAGVLYEVDMRLRPNGASGLLVSPMSAFERYQNESAWTWEHQALVRARVIVGSESLRERFEQARATTLRQPRDREHLREEVGAMRERMRRELAKESDGRFDLKRGRGGVADIEFMVQYGVLAGASATPSLVDYSDNIRLLEALAAAGEFESDDAQLLMDAYRTFRARIHRLALLDEPAVVEPDPELTEYREAVASLWLRWFGGDPDRVS